MKLRILFLLLTFPCITFSQQNFNEFFRTSSMRFDFLLGGNASEVRVYPKQIKKKNIGQDQKIILLIHLIMEITVLEFLI